MRSMASPKACAELCQNTAFPSGSSNLINCSVQSPSSGRSKSHSTLLILATIVASAKPWLIPVATAYGVVSQDVPATTLPSGSVMEISDLGLAAFSSSNCFLNLSQSWTRSSRNCGGGLNSFTIYIYMTKPHRFYITLGILQSICNAILPFFTSPTPAASTFFCFSFFILASCKNINVVSLIRSSQGQLHYSELISCLIMVGNSI